MTPINVVRAKTVDLLVPAEAEIVIEGFIDTEYLEPEAPFGESHGYVNLQEYNAFMNVTAITRRRNAILTSFISQVTPSESSVIRRVAMEPVFLHHLQSVMAVKSVKAVAMHEPLTSLYAVIGIQFERGAPETEIWRALDGASTLHRFAGKWIIAVDEDIDPHNADALFWAMSYRCQPQHDLLVVPHKHPGHGPRGPRDGGETRERADQCDAEGHLRAGGAAAARIHGAGEADLGTGSACRRSSRKAPGTAMISATGRTTWHARRAWLRPATTLRSAAKRAISDAKTSK